MPKIVFIMGEGEGSAPREVLKHMFKTDMVSCS